ncbi:hypothetical protein Y5S_00713 [Alcanivorax nanhaiticus]|uniref:Uncharacterized protein n=1 Tax=Alcanivorax nanhaiticus TaxID=1177154 RepID=A0A095SNJ9_9GAMM|nr:hypothetical protein [Alcanivorax nanhaiticus]KGD66241.1 hypothetical protein Y5S_00713 [Alcanivorax nanhaiticus]
MELNKASTRNAWAAVDHLTRQVRSGDLNPALAQWVNQQGLDLDHTVFSSVCLFDEGVYTGTLVDGDGRVWEFLADLNDPQASEMDDVTSELGPKSPEHPRADPCDLITMSILYQRDEQVAA